MKNNENIVNRTFMFNIVTLLNYHIFIGSVDVLEVSGKKLVINTINAYSYVMAKKDTEFKQALHSCDVLLPDGIPVVWAARLLKGLKIKKIAGEDIFKYLIAQAEKNFSKVFFLGSSPETLSRIKEKVLIDYPHVKVETYSPPFIKEFADSDNRIIIERINSFEPNILFVGMTAPKQEKWVHQHKQQIKANTICSIGAVFDFYAGTVKRPSPFWVSLRLEWFIRLIKEPRRLWKRYLIYSPQFFMDVFKAKIKSQLH